MNSWKLAANIAKWTGESVGLSFDQSNPTQGINVDTPAVVTEPASRLFGTYPPIDSKAPAAKQVTCCGDSIRVTFAEKDRFPVETQLGWRASKTSAGFTILDVVVSVGTQLLDAYPEFGLWSQLDATEVLVPQNSTLDRNSDWASIAPPVISNAAKPIPSVLFRLRGTDLSYVEMVHPDDFYSYEIARESDSGQVALRHRLFACSLEKGVILRARLRGVLLPRDGDCSAAADSFAQFVAAAPPLGR